jgi:hypothetical protein
MTDRTNIKTTEEIRDELREYKRDGETWDGLLRRAADALESDADRDQYPGAPRCTECGSIAHGWTVEAGRLRCGVCAEGEVEAGFEE